MKYTSFDEEQFRHSGRSLFVSSCSNFIYALFLNDDIFMLLMKNRFLFEFSLVTKAVRKVETILGTTKQACFAADDPDHSYQDKYALVEVMTNSSLLSLLHVLNRLGLDDTKLHTLLEWVHRDHKTVTLSFEAQTTCTFVKETQVDHVVSAPMYGKTTTTTETSSEEAKGSESFEDDLPPGWKRMTDPSTDRAYYYNSETAETSWERPTASGSVSAENGPRSEMQVEEQSTDKKESAAGTKKETKSTTTVHAKVIRKVTQHHWKVGIHYVITAYPGTDKSSGLELLSQSSSTVLVTSAGMVRGDGVTPPPKPPLPEKTIHSPVELNLTWLLTMLQDPTTMNNDGSETNSNVVCQFAIDREASSCRTPRRNDPVYAALAFQALLQEWVQQVLDFFVERVHRGIVLKHNLLPNGNSWLVGDAEEANTTGELCLLSGTNGKEIFTPILPLMEQGSVLSPEDQDAIMEAHFHSLEKSCTDVAQAFPSANSTRLVTCKEATMVLLCNHTMKLIGQYQNSVDYVENMLKKQLIQAIGKEVSSNDFDKFMRFHNRKLLGPNYAPKPFTHAIRRPNAYPDGILSIEATTSTHTEDKDGMDASIETMCRHISGQDSPSIFIPISAATSVEITGDRFLHGWIQHRFESEPTSSYQIAARARQFSSFLLILGTMAGKDKFMPKNAIILQNKDEVLIPLFMEVIPTAKEFKDAISSLSPEQQAFAKAFRAMQLESSVFALCVVQLKPQLEKLLGLPVGALTKEIKLTQDLMSLFVDNQIPSDLLSYTGGNTGDSMESKLASVKANVKAVMDVIDAAKEKQIMEEERKSEMRQAQFGAVDQNRSFRAPHPPPAPSGFGFAASAPPLPFGSAACQLAAVAPPKPAVMFACEAPATRSATLVQPRGLGESGPDEIWSCPSTDCYDEMDDMETEENLCESSEETFKADQVPTPKRVKDIDDFTLVPKALDTKIEKLDSDNSLKSTILKTDTVWKRLRQANLLSPFQSKSLNSVDIRSEKNKAFDLLDAISRSGTLTIECAELHVVVAVSHCFENDVMGSIIQDNVNPIEKVERSSLIVGSIIYDEPTRSLLQQTNIDRLGATFPALFDQEQNATVEE